MKFKNDKERIAFLENRSAEDGWYLWKEDCDLNRRWIRFDFSDCALVVEEQLQTFQWPNKHQRWNVVHWYIIKDWHGLFADQVASRTLALAELKRSGKEA